VTVPVGESEDAGASPWAGEVPVPAQPVEFTWAKSGDSEGAWLGAEANDRADGASEVGDGHPVVASSERRRWAIGSIAAVILLALGWLVVGRGSGGDSLDATEQSTPADTTGDSVVEDSLPRLDEEPPDTEPKPAPDRTIPGNASLDEADVPEWQNDSIDLPPVLRASTTPFDVVGLTGDGTYVEVAIPSGQVNSLEIRRGAQGQVIAGATTTLLTSYTTRQDAQLLRIGEQPTDVALPDNVDGMQVAADSDQYVGIASNNGPSPDRVEIGADGSVIVSEATASDRNIWQQQYLADGSRLVTEAGGVYRIAEDVFTRISTGVLIAASNDHVLVRECDDTMQCGHATIAASTGERTDVVLEAREVSPFGFGATELSPDGKWLRYLEYSETSVDEVLIELATGDRTDLPGSNTYFWKNDGQENSSVWAADSSGFFRPSPTSGFEFFDVGTGEVIRFGEDVGRIQSFDIRISWGAPAVAEPTPTSAGIELIAITVTGDIAEIDVDSGAVVTTEGQEPDGTSPAIVFVDAVGAVITSYDDTESLRFDAGTGTVSATDAQESRGPLIFGQSSTSIWRYGDGDVEFELVDPLGSPLDISIDIDSDGQGDLVGSDGAGGILIGRDLGGVFVLTAPDQAERLTSGEVLAINAQTAYVRECDASLRCGVFIVDRATGDRVPIELSILDRAGDIDGGRVPSGQNVSPDGQVVFVRDVERPSQAMMIDAAEDLWTAAQLVDTASPIIWTADSGYAVWLSDGRVTVYERSTRSIRTINTAKLHAIGEVPSS
jgi:hypothetical protein